VATRDTMKRLFARRPYLPHVVPISSWLIFIVVAPLGIIIYFSFLTSGAYGGKILPIFTLENYRILIQGPFMEVALRTIILALGTNAICLVIGYTVAYFIVRFAGRWGLYLIMLIIIPSWTSYLIRLYALRTLVGSAGPISQALLSLGLISSPLHVLYTPGIVLFGLVYTWLPFMVLPLYASLVGLEPSLLEAAEDLGASPLRRFFTVTLPLTKGGIFAGTILVFIPTLGTWLVPMLLGGSKVMMAGNLVQLYFMMAGNIPAGCSVAAMLTAMVILTIYLIIKLGGEDALERIV